MSSADPVWDAVPIPTQTGLAELREVVLEHTAKRFPKWKLRVAPDLVMQIQPRPGRYRGLELLFECDAYAGDVGTKIFTQKAKNRPRPMPPHVAFNVCKHEGNWRVKPTCLSVGRDDPDNGRRLLARIVAEFTAGRFSRLSPRMMMSGYCLICGKGLTDAASMARLVGPECAGTSRLTGVFTFDLGDDKEPADLLTCTAVAP